MVVGIPITLPVALLAVSSGDLKPGIDVAAWLTLWTEALGAVAAFRKPLPSRRRAFGGAAIFAMVGVMFFARQQQLIAAGSPWLALGPLIGWPLGAWLFGGWRAGLAAGGLVVLWYVIAFS